MRNESKNMDIKKLKLWDDNPRIITAENYERLKNHIKKYSQYKPLIINQHNIVIGGNMRLRAMEELGFKEVWVVMVTTKGRPEMIEYALSDNEQFGEWDEEKLAEMLTEDWVDIDVKNFKIDFGKKSLEDLMNEFGPSDDDQEEEDEDEDKKKTVECPKCHHIFTP